MPSSIDECNTATAKASRRHGARRWELEALTPGESNGNSFAVEKAWASATVKIDEHNLLWKQYAVLVDLYKYYLELAWKVSVWYYATSGAILTYFFANVGQPGKSVLPYLLWFYGAASLGFGYLSWRGGGHLFGMIKLFESIAERLGLPGRPHVEFACVFLLISGVMFAALGVAGIALFFAAPWSSSP
jgi:hypothetical protein